jgi:hypothetical protein
MNSLDLRQAISDALSAFATLPLRDAGLKLLETMGYKSEKTFDLSPNSAETFLAQFDPFAFVTACGFLDQGRDDEGRLGESLGLNLNLRLTLPLDFVMVLLYLRTGQNTNMRIQFADFTFPDAGPSRIDAGPACSGAAGSAQDAKAPAITLRNRLCPA